MIINSRQKRNNTVNLNGIRSSNFAEMDSSGQKEDASSEQVDQNDILEYIDQIKAPP